MTTTELLFAVFPYVAITLLVVVTTIRWRRHPFSVSSLSSQLLESRRLYWGSVPFHWGISVILLGHLFALLVPDWLEMWNGVSIRLYLLEASGLALGLWAAVGLAVLLVRRLTNRRVRAVSTPMDLVVLTLVVVQVVTGIWVAVGYRWGSFWGTSVFVPYVRSILVVDPRPDYVEALPFVLKLHAFTFWVFVALFPFTRLVHIITLPLGYITRPWQRVVRMGEDPAVYHPAAEKTLERRP
ncbi:MAG: respiratory nitrate reductase subunit gamma [Acidimicrobiales bacterium]